MMRMTRHLLRTQCIEAQASSTDGLTLTSRHPLRSVLAGRTDRATAFLLNRAVCATSLGIGANAAFLRPRRPADAVSALRSWLPPVYGPGSATASAGPGAQVPWTIAQRDQALPGNRSGTVAGVALSTESDAPPAVDAARSDAPGH